MIPRNPAPARRAPTADRRPGAEHVDQPGQQQHQHQARQQVAVRSEREQHPHRHQRGERAEGDREPAAERATYRRTVSTNTTPGDDAQPDPRRRVVGVWRDQVERREQHSHARHEPAAADHVGESSAPSRSAQPARSRTRLASAHPASR